MTDFPPHDPDYPDVHPVTGDERETTEGPAEPPRRSSDFALVERDEQRDRLNDLADSRHTEGFQFIVDDAGDWYARSNVQGPGFTETRWWYVTGVVPDDLDGIIAIARTMAHE